MRFLYVYLMKDDPNRVRAVAPEHAAYWQGMRLGGYLGGPFTDRSGGTITFEAGSQAEAERLVGDDPFARDDLLENLWVKQWMVDS
ncbi:MAG TPA: YciI family protein [Actinomycetota bacterium]|nr:YciI family protein [Actinomycetota bacterium]